MRSLGYSVSKATLANYLRHLNECYFAFPVEVFSPKVKLRIQYPKKIYFVDTSLLTFLSVRFSKNIGRLMENAVFIELMRRGESVNYAIPDSWEIDFVLPEREELIQVSYDISSPETFNREIKALKKAKWEFGWEKTKLITWDVEKKVEGGGNSAMEVPP